MKACASKPQEHSFYDIVDEGMSDIESGRSRDAKTLTADVRKQYDL